MRILCLLIYLTTCGRASSSQNIVFTNTWQSGGGTYTSEGSCTFTLNRRFAAGEWTMAVTTIQPTLSMTSWKLGVTNKQQNTYFLESQFDFGPSVEEVIFHIDHSTLDPLTAYCNSNSEPDVTTQNNVVTTIDDDLTTTQAIKTSKQKTTTHKETTRVNAIYTTLPKNEVRTTTNDDISASINIDIVTTNANTRFTEQHTSVIDTTAANHVTMESSSQANDQTSTTNTEACVQTNYLCLCNNYLTDEEIQRKVTDLVDILKIDKKTTTRARALKSSADDRRQSAAAIGTAGVVILCVCIGMIVLMDIPRLVVYIKNKI